MDADTFTEWLHRQGHRVVRTTSSCWAEFGPNVYQAFPYHHMISPSDEEIKSFMREQKAVALRYSTPLNAHTGSLSYHVVYESKLYVQSDLPKKARYDVKKGLSVANVEPISLERLATEGWNLRRETLARQGRSRAETEEGWKGICLSAKYLPGFEAWGAIAEGKLVAALLGFASDGYFSILYQQSLTDYLPFGVNNALAFVMTSEALNRLEIERVFYGLHSLDAPASVDQFKFRMGYVAKPVRQMVVFHPALQPMINPVSHAALRIARKGFPGNPTLSKAEGLVRFSLQGRRPLLKQPRPEPLRDIVFP